MNTLRTAAVASTVLVAMLGALMSPAASAQAPSSPQRIEVTDLASNAEGAQSEYERVPQAPFFGLRSRAEVRAELAAWQKAGSIGSGYEYVPNARFVGLRSRAEVLAELAAWQKAGSIGSGYEYTPGAHSVSNNARARASAQTAAAEPA